MDDGRILDSLGPHKCDGQGIGKKADAQKTSQGQAVSDRFFYCLEQIDDMWMLRIA